MQDCSFYGYNNGEFTSISWDVEPRKIRGIYNHLQLELHPKLYVLYSFCLQVLTIRVWLSWILTAGLFEKAGMLHLFGILGYCSLVRDTCVFLWWFSWGEKQLSQLHPLFWIVFRVVEAHPEREGQRPRRDPRRTLSPPGSTTAQSMCSRAWTSWVQRRALDSGV